MPNKCLKIFCAIQLFCLGLANLRLQFFGVFLLFQEHQLLFCLHFQFFLIFLLFFQSFACWFQCMLKNSYLATANHFLVVWPVKTNLYLGRIIYPVFRFVDFVFLYPAMDGYRFLEFNDWISDLAFCPWSARSGDPDGHGYRSSHADHMFDCHPAMRA